LVPRDGETKALGKLGDLVGLGELGISDLGSVRGYAGLMSQQEAVESWAKHNGAGGHALSQYVQDLNPRDGCRVKREVYGGGRNEVVAYTIEGGGHAWPGGLPIGGVMGRTTQDIKASELIVQFFSSH
jgi:poly(3-hydroxybutyrate) depolymerase